MSGFDGLKERIDQGRDGLNRGFSTGSRKLDSVIQGVQRRTFYVLGGGVGTGKSALCDASFVLNPYREMLRIIKEGTEKPLKLRVFYNSFEIEKINKLAKWVCYFIYMDYGKVYDINFILSIGKNKISQEVYEMICKYQDYVEQMEDYIHITDTSTNPTGIYMDIKKYMDLNGKVEPTKKLVRGHEITFQKYIPNNPDEIVISITDHVGLLRVEKDCHTKKERIDRYSEQCISLRNFYGVSSVALSQFNRELADLDRRKFAELTPQLEDFKDTGGLSEDGNVVMALFNPLRYNIVEYNGINIMSCGGRYRPIIVLKTRDGSDMVKINQNFLGEIGHFRDFPDPIMQHNYREAKEYTKFT
jgi:hypothetical protein